MSHMKVVVLVPVEVEIDQDHKALSVTAPTLEDVQPMLDEYGAFADKSRAMGYLLEAQNLFASPAWR